VSALAIDNDKLPWQIDINVFMTAISHVNWDTNTVDSNCIRNGYKSSTGAQNAEINFDLPIAAGTWTIELLHVKSTTHGIFSVQIDGIEVGTADAYSASAVFNNRTSVSGVVIATAGKHRLKLKMTTKNVSSGGYFGAIQHIQLRRTA
jgi:hypothetical protein